MLAGAASISMEWREMTYTWPLLELLCTCLFWTASRMRYLREFAMLLLEYVQRPAAAHETYIGCIVCVCAIPSTTHDVVKACVHSCIHFLPSPTATESQFLKQVGSGAAA